MDAEIKASSFENLRLSTVPFLKPAVSKNYALQASLALGDNAFFISKFPIHSTPFLPLFLKHKVSRRLTPTSTWDLRNFILAWLSSLSRLTGGQVSSTCLSGCWPVVKWFGWLGIWLTGFLLACWGSVNILAGCGKSPRSVCLDWVCKTNFCIGSHRRRVLKCIFTYVFSRPEVTLCDWKDNKIE